jgi:hypothetical protein
VLLAAFAADVLTVIGRDVCACVSKGGGEGAEGKETGGRSGTGGGTVSWLSLSTGADIDIDVAAASAKCVGADAGVARHFLLFCW